jgi:hypothetical protein
VHIGPAISLEDRIPELRDDVEPPTISGAAAIAAAAFAGAGLDALLAMVDRPAPDLAHAAAALFDMALAQELSFRPAPARALQTLALHLCPVLRVQAGAWSAKADGRKLRLLALMAPGDLMMNTPLDFITAHLDIQLDLLFLLPGRKLPAVIPDHDVAFFAVSEADPAALQRLIPLFRKWPRPALNDPAGIVGWSRDHWARELADAPGICSPPTRRLTRAELATDPAAGRIMPGSAYPLLIRPVGSHAGTDLAKADDADDLACYVSHSAAEDFFVTAFVDYRSSDSLYRKYRVAFFDGAPFLCHMAASEHWMVHYLNAGMTESAAKRDDEARAMAGFDEGFARRHASAFAALNRRIGLDYFSIDCSETRDGRLLVFEADVAAIIHMMDPPDLFAYKRPHMQRVFDSFADMLRRRC